MNININGASFCAEENATVYDAAQAAGLISREILAAEVNGELSALSRPLAAGDDVKLLTFADKGGAHVFNHTAAHVLAQAVKRLYPATKLTIGPAIDGGFYYDFDSEISFTPDVLTALEGEMKKIVKENLRIERFELPREEAIALMTERDEPYKVQLINELPADATISFYEQGEFTDLCAGPHLFST
ncbi:MAG: threonine--tRNA ligase, partial [Clostridia bacterium]|nr:threonine--tRNA ligase [Clostridia bacterium]